MTTISVVTPTYNRAYILHVLYQSLNNQTYRSFEWIVVDDGSTDNTREMIKKWAAEAEFPIVYVYQENAGMNKAIEKGLSIARMELTAKVDSDDYLVAHALRRIAAHWDENKGDKYFGILSPRFISSTGNYRYKPFPEGVKEATSIELYRKYKYKGETFPVYVTELAKKTKYPDIKGQRVEGSGYLMDQSYVMGYKFLLLPEKLYAYEYILDGLTKNRKPVKDTYKNIDALIEVRIFQTRKEFPLTYRYKKMIELLYFNWYKYGFIKGFTMTQNVLLAFLAFPASVIYILRMLVLRFKERKG